MIRIEKIDFLDILIRVLKTFTQGFLGALVVTMPTVDLKDKAVMKSLTIGGISAGICAAMNLIIELLK